jgi:hypothetical protein
LWLDSSKPQLIGLGPSLGLLVGFAVLLAMARANRRRWLGAA